MLLIKFYSYIIVDPKENKKSVIKLIKVSSLAKIGPQRSKHYFVPVVFTFDGNNIFILIDNNTKKLKKLHYFKRIKKYTKKYQL